MAADKFSALWISHTSLNDFLHCPRAYYLKNIFRDPKTNHKIKIMSPPLALGQAVHDVIESLSILPVDKRFREPLMDKFEKAWEKVSGKKGGFAGDDIEAIYKNKGREMISRIFRNPGPIARKAVKLKKELPYCWISEEENIILCGKVDWLEYLPQTDCIHIIDFKTSKHDEDPDSLQLPIYYLLVKMCQSRQITKISYWYLERSDELTEKELPDGEKAKEKILDIARQIKAMKQLDRFKCQTDGCKYCKPFETVVKGDGEFVYVDGYGTDVYILSDVMDNLEDESEIL